MQQLFHQIAEVKGFGKKMDKNFEFQKDLCRCSICTLVIHQFEIFDWPIKLNSIFKCWPKDQTFFQLYFFPSGKSRLLCICIACLSVFSTLILQFLGKNDHFLTCYLYLKFNHFGKNWRNVLYIRTLVAALIM